MELKHRIEEILETLWIETAERKNDGCDFSILRDDDAIKELQKSGGIVTEGTKISLTEKGMEEAKSCVRRHRLAERLLVDVLDVADENVHETGCKFEHLLHAGLEENICALLGHPKTCPHGHPIPPGACCTDEGRAKLKKIVMPLPELEKEKKARVAYLHTGNRDALKKLLAMGIFPNSEIFLIQKKPSFVFQVGKSQFAVDREMAANIYVRAV